MNIDPNLVRYSRAGDAFHYRWAARRCLRMVNPTSSIKLISIEGSKENKLAGEYVIDVAEYYENEDLNEKTVTYFQLKHSTKRLDSPFKLSDLKGTIEGFSERYKANNEDRKNSKVINFTIITNRSISENCKNNFRKIIDGHAADKLFLKTIKKYTKLEDSELAKFCTILNLEDGEGNYIEQRFDLHAELSELQAGVIENPQIDTIIAMVAEKALPDNDGEIIREDILKRLGVESDRDLFPAPTKLESIADVIKREQHDVLLDIIIKANAPVIIHAEGGVGKSILCNQFTESLPPGSKGIIYDCFGAGKYRSRIEPRHRYRDALVQISNELAISGLCKFLIPCNSNTDVSIMRAFMNRITTSISSLRKYQENAILILFIDAADNAEMAANEFGEFCFANQLLREQFPDGVKLVALCRTERIPLLKPQSYIIRKELLPFNYTETLFFLNQHFSNVSKVNGMEFYRLTSGNPRVQANALMIGCNTISEVLSGFGPSPISVNDQIEAQLRQAICKLKEALPEVHQKQIELICLGLANFQPFIPMKVLAIAANVEESAIKSFVSDLGRPLWLFESSVQFRDEPTETWFRKQFSANKEQIESFIHNIKPMAATIPYVSEALPSLLLQAECYEELVKLSLTDELLPEDSPIDARNIRIYRLQFAFKAALKAKKFADASKLAMRAGEEVSGSNRQIDLLAGNIDLIAPLQSSQRVQELAFRRLLRRSWEGSENVYSAALLSSVPEFKGEAISYLKSAENWLKLYFDERNKLKNKKQEEKLDDDEIIELAYSHYQLYGEKELIRFIMNWRPPEVILRIASAITRKLVDVSGFDAIDKILQYLLPEDIVRYQYFCLAVINELWKVFRTPSSNVLRTCLDLLLQKTTQLPEQENRLGEKLRLPEIVSFAEVCSAKNLSKIKIRNLLKLNTEKYASYDVRHEHYHRERYDYLRGVALDAVLAGNLDFEIEVLLPKDWLEKEKKHYESQELKQFKELIGGMLPWHIVRAKTIVGNISDLTDELKLAHQRSTAASRNRYREYDTLSYEISHIRFEILAIHSDPPKPAINQFLELVTSENIKYRLDDLLQALRCSYRQEHLKPLRDTLESRCYQITSQPNNETPEDKANNYILLARAVFPENIADAKAYFDYAIEAVSKFGDEVIHRWEAATCIAKRSAFKGNNNPEMAYRFIRCAEMIGEHAAGGKYFNRNEAIEICAMISPQIAFSTLSRWRDRDVGWFEDQLPSLIHQCVKMGNLSPAAAWSFTAFSGCRGDESLVRWCFDNECDPINRQRIIDITVRDFLILNSEKKELRELKEIAEQVSIDNTDLDEALSYYESIPEKRTPTDSFRNTITYRDIHEPGVNWDEILKDLEINSAADINEAIERFNDLEGPRSPEAFWTNFYKKLDTSNAYYFLKNLIDAESADRYDVQNALKYFPMKFRSKASIKKLYPQVIQTISRRFATEFTNQWAIKHFIESIGEEGLIDCIQQGVIEGLSDLSQFISATTFFGFASSSTSYISPEEANDVLDFSLSRFEEHVAPEYGDGSWDNWLIPSENIVQATTGLIWSALGSPRSSIRWEAAHCVRRLAILGCRNEIDALIDWMESGVVGAFGCNAFPFYALHAKQYLLIALARIAIESTLLLKSHYKIFSKIALEDPPHVLIQKFSAEIVLSIEKNYPGTYDSLIVEQVKKIGISPFPVKTIDDKEDMQSTLFHTQNERDNNLEMYFSWDFDKYWFEPLGSIFNISSEQVQKLARHVVIKQWKLIPVDKFINDPRNILWRSRRYERETSHDHGSYPVTDNYNFYISYHAMLTVAAKLKWYRKTGQVVKLCYGHYKGS